jgi:hypothetical protein
MEKCHAKQEILLLTSSSFAQRDLCKNEFFEEDDRQGLSPVERLEEACWNGLLKEFISSTSSNHENGDKLFLWKIRVSETFLYVELCQAPSPLDYYSSLDPCLFLRLMNCN